MRSHITTNMEANHMPSFIIRDAISGLRHGVDVDTIDAAKAAAHEWQHDGYCGEPSASTFWVDTYIIEVGPDGAEETVATVTTAIDPSEPDCTEKAHDWQSPHEIVGGLKENPGVWGNGGGVRIVEVCMHCGCRRETNTWATRPDTGEQGLRSLRYLYPDQVGLERPGTED